MGWLADLLQELPVSAALRIKLEQKEVEFEKLQTELQEIKEQNAWLKGELDRAKGVHASLQPVAEALLKHIANNPGTIPAQLKLGVSRAEIDHHTDVLREREFIFFAGPGPSYKATAQGRQYLAENKLL